MPHAVLLANRIGVLATSWIALAAASPAAAAPTPAAPAPAPAAFQPEISDVASLPPAGPHRVWLQEMLTGSAQVVDGDTGELLATIPAAPLSNFNAGPGQRTVYVAETIWSKGNRGQRQDMVSAYDGISLKLIGEIPLAGRVFMVPTQQTFGVSPGAGRAYVYNMQPSSSVSVVDLARQKVVRVVETPGCALVFPWGTDGFSSLCGDGSLATVASDAPKLSLVRSKPFFDAEHDPVFETSPTDPKTGQTVFVTYSGVVHPVTLGPTPAFAAAWSLQQAAGLPAAGLEDGALAWRPGGRIPMALQAASSRLYVLMHAGEHWSHKKDGTELWIVDLKARTVVRRAALDGPVSAVAVSQDDHPLLYLLDDKQGLSIRDANTLKELRHVDDVGRVLPYVPPL